MGRAEILLEPLENRRLLSAAVLIADHPASLAPAAASTAATAATPQPTNGGVTLTEEATQQFTAKLGHFTFKTVDQLINATINWGDGTHSAGTIQGAYNGAEFYVVGTHTYAKTGQFKVNVTIQAQIAGNPNAPKFTVASFTSIINVIPLKPSSGGLSLTEVVGQSFATTLGEFQFKTVDQQLTAVVYWGDGTHSNGTLIGSYATGNYYVLGTHSYAKTGTFKVQVKIFAKPLGSTIQPTTPVAQFISVMKVVGSA
jgi:hypothetical protein